MMQSIASKRRRFLQNNLQLFINQFKRTSSSTSSSSILSNSNTNSSSLSDQSTILVEGNACSRTVILNRPNYLNALNTSMGHRLHKLYKSWEMTPDIGFVVMKGSGRAFCAGGDIVSLYEMVKKVFKAENSLSRLMTFEEAFEMFSKGMSTRGPYWDHVKGYYMAALDHPGKILFLKYEDLQVNTANEIKRLSDFLGKPFGLEEEEEGVVQHIIKLCNFENLKEVDKNGKFGEFIPNTCFFRKGKVGDWSNYLTDEMSRALDQITKEKFHGLDISF